jgi:hypothetical protein
MARKMTATQIFIKFEKMAIQWGKKHQIAKVGEIVTSKIGKKTARFKISDVTVTIGRNAQETTRKTLVIVYCGRKINSKGEFIDELGCGRLLTNFVTNDGKFFDHIENQVTEFCTDSGLTFHVDFEQECKDVYPNAHSSYKEPFFKFSYSR